MTDIPSPPGQVRSHVSMRRPAAFAVLALALTGLALAVLPHGLARNMTLAFAAAMATALLVHAWTRLQQRRVQTAGRKALIKIAELGFDPLVMSDGDGRITFCNQPAAATFGDILGKPLSQVLESRFAAPDFSLSKLMQRAGRSGTAAHDILTSDQHLRLSVLSHDPCFLWRLELLGGDRFERESSLKGLDLPILRVAPDGSIDALSDGFRDAFDIVPERIEDLLVEAPLVPGRPQIVRTGNTSVQKLFLQLSSDETGTTYAVLDDIGPGPDLTALDALPIATMQLEPGGRITRVNAAAHALLRLDGDMPKEFSDLVEGLGRPVPEWLSDMAEGRGAGRPEVLRLAGAPEDRFLQVAIRPFQSETGRALLAVLTDATELKSLEMQFVQSQKMQAIGQLAGGVAHDFNNLLTAISGHCDLLLLNRDEGDPEFGDLMQIHHNANRAASLVRQLLAFSRTQTLDLTPLDLRDTLAEMAHLLNRLVGERIRLVQSHDPALAPIRGDQRQIEQVLMNLVVNARDAMPSGGEIRIQTSVKRLSRALKRDNATIPAGEYVTVSVEDCGSGMPPQVVERIFEPFFSTKPVGEGTGLGLSTAYGIIKQLGGFIFCDSEVGKGTRFTLYFAAHREVPVPRKTEPQRTAAISEPVSAGVILLVEDEAPVRAFAARALRLKGHVVLEASNAEDALKLLEDPALQIDVFVTDVVMPGLDGPAWVKRALASRPKTQVIFMSGYSEETVARQRGEVANSVFIPKPFSLVQLSEAVTRQLADHSARKAAS